MDDVLSKWLNGECSDEELKSALGEDEAKKYIQIVGEVDSWVPDQSSQLSDPGTITSMPKAKIRSMRPWMSYAAAAVVVLTIVSYFWILMGDNTVTYSSAIGEVREIVLPDGISTVTLAPNSEVSWDKEDWGEAVAMKENRSEELSAKGRKVKLKGKALFKIEKGDNFSVESSMGVVEVLGTVFEVDDFSEGISVLCFEGEVRAKPKRNKKSVRMIRGVGYLFIDGKWEKKKVSGSLPSWIQGETEFENAPLVQVIKSLEKTYGVTIKREGVNLSRRFTGTIPNDKLEVALRLVFKPYGIDYERQGKEITLSEDN
ncbi:MAG: FecR domain-containing protein [Ekhidna sp.]